MFWTRTIVRTVDHPRNKRMYIAVVTFAGYESEAAFNGSAPPLFTYTTPDYIEPGVTIFGDSIDEALIERIAPDVVASIELMLAKRAEFEKASGVAKPIAPREPVVIDQELAAARAAVRIVVDLKNKLAAMDSKDQTIIDAVNAEIAAEQAKVDAYLKSNPGALKNL